MQLKAKAKTIVARTQEKDVMFLFQFYNYNRTSISIPQYESQRYSIGKET